MELELSKFMDMLIRDQEELDYVEGMVGIDEIDDIASRVEQLELWLFKLKFKLDEEAYHVMYTYVNRERKGHGNREEFLKSFVEEYYES